MFSFVFCEFFQNIFFQSSGWMILLLKSVTTYSHNTYVILRRFKDIFEKASSNLLNDKSMTCFSWWNTENIYVWNHGLREKCPNAEFFLVRIFLYSDWIRSVLSQNTGKYGPEKTPYLDTFDAAVANPENSITIFKNGHKNFQNIYLKSWGWHKYRVI